MNKAYIIATLCILGCFAIGVFVGFNDAKEREAFTKICKLKHGEVIIAKGNKKICIASSAIINIENK